jgi:hypothetical protein
MLVRMPQSFFSVPIVARAMRLLTVHCDSMLLFAAHLFYAVPWRRLNPSR